MNLLVKFWVGECLREKLDIVVFNIGYRVIIVNSLCVLFLGWVIFVLLENEIGESEINLMFGEIR